MAGEHERNHLAGIVEAFIAAESGLTQIRRILKELNIATRMPNDAASLPPAQMQLRQQAVDQLITSLDQVTETYSIGATKLLDGTWTVSLAHPISGEIAILRLPSMSSRNLGNDQIGGRLNTLVTGGSSAINQGNPARCSSIVQCALLQAAAASEDLGRYLGEVVEPSLIACEVMCANAVASNTAIFDLDFTLQTSQLTPLDALANAQKLPTSHTQSNSTKSPSLSLRHNDEG